MADWQARWDGIVKAAETCAALRLEAVGDIATPAAAGFDVQGLSRKAFDGLVGAGQLDVVTHRGTPLWTASHGAYGDAARICLYTRESAPIDLIEEVDRMIAENEGQIALLRARREELANR